MATAVRSFCKINLGLAVGPPRQDGFHGLTTLYQTLGLHDRTTVVAARAPRTHISLDANHPGVPCTRTGDCERNTAYRIAAGMLKQLGVTAEVHISIEKQLPVQGGLGAGSANAAATLLALEHELGEALTAPERLALAAEVGSDVPLFLLGGTVLGVDRGQEVYPLPDLPTTSVVVAVPSVGVSTAQAFRDLDARLQAQAALHSSPGSRDGLTRDGKADRLRQLSYVLASAWTPMGSQLEGKRVPTGIASSPTFQPAGQGGLPQSSRSMDGDLAESPGFPEDSFPGLNDPLLALVRTGVENDFEEVAFRQHPSLRDIKRALTGDTAGPAAGSGALHAALSGSGSALFGLYTSPEDARAAQQRVQSLGTRALLTETLPRQRYWEQIFA